MMAVTVWLLSAAGLLQPDGTPVPAVPFEKAPVLAGDVRDGKVAVIVRDREVWVHADGKWDQWVAADLVLNCLAWTREGRLLAGTERARLAWVGDGEFDFIESFDEVEGRKDWNTPWGGPPDTRSLAIAADGTIYADIHVGWIVRSRDGGKTWENLRNGLDKDVHMVAAHPTRPATVFCATARGFHISNDHGDTFERRSEPMPYYYQRACACFPDRDVYLVSTSRGPRGGGALLFRSDDEGKTWNEVEGLPETIDANINTYQITALAGGHGYVIVENEMLYETNDYGATWTKVDGAFPRLYTAVTARP